MVPSETRELVRRAAALEPEAWDALVDRYSRLVWGILRKAAGLNRAAQEDLYQEVFAALLRGGLSQFHGETEWELRAFLRTIAGNKIKDYHRARSRNREVAEEGHEEARPDPSWSEPESQDPEESAAMRQILDQAVRCLQVFGVRALWTT
jgi:RNA polymerase sigma factor (sigma-70 family)